MMSNTLQHAQQTALVTVSAKSLQSRNCTRGSFGAKRLPNPFAIVTKMSSKDGEEPIVLGKTETITKSSNPTWTYAFKIDFTIGRLYYINVGIHDESSKQKYNNKPLGSAIFEIGDILGASGNVKGKTIKNRGVIYVRVMPVTVDYFSAPDLVLELKGLSLKNTEGVFRKSDPFYELQRRDFAPGGGYNWYTVCRSEHVDNELDPVWKPTAVNVDRLCDNDHSIPFRICVFDWSKKGNYTDMGMIETNLEVLLNAKSPKHFTLRNQKGKECGVLAVTRAEMECALPNSAIPAGTEYRSLDPPSAPPSTKRPTFVEYISSGCELNMCVAIDFTASNGDPGQPGTLHNISLNGHMNDYQKAITAVGSVIAKYDHDQHFPVWGFGAKFDGEVRHVFQVGHSAQLNGISGILEGYRSVFSSPLRMSEPTVFSEVIQCAKAFAINSEILAKESGQMTYTVLLLLTDGAVSDIEITRDALIEASNAPLSVVIVGLGNADFSRMQFLDDMELQPPARDITQFVEFNKHVHDKSSLTASTLDEIPNQLVDYFVSRQIMPSKITRRESGSISVEAYNAANDDDIELEIEYDNDGKMNITNGRTLYNQTSYGSQSNYLPKAIPVPEVGTAPTNTSGTGEHEMTEEEMIAKAIACSLRNP